VVQGVGVALFLHEAKNTIAPNNKMLVNFFMGFVFMGLKIILHCAAINLLEL